MQAREQTRLALGMNLDLTALYGNPGSTQAGFNFDREDGPGNHNINPRRRHLKAPDGVMANFEARATACHPQGYPALRMAKQADI